MRHLKAAIVIGAVSALVVLLLVATHWIAGTPDTLLRKGLGLTKPHSISLGWQIAIFSALAFGVAWTTVDITRWGLKATVAGALAVLLVTGSLVLAPYNVYFSPFPSVFAVALSFGLGLAYGRSGSGSRKKHIERLFYRRVSRGDFARLVNGEVSAEFPGALIEGTTVVCSIKNHRELVELLSPEDYASMSNLYLQTASDFLVEVGGYLDECTGESLRVIFGAPVADPKHAAKACRAALDLMSRLDILNKECDATWQRRFEFCVGINSGPMIGAAFGGSRLANYSVAGPSVDFARRLCLACGTYGARILAGPETLDQAPELFETRPIETLKGTGSRRHVELHEILAPRHGLSPERERSRDHFWRGVLYYREKKWEKAVEEFQQSRILGIPDAVLDFYVRRVESARRGTAPAANELGLVFEAV